MADVADLGEKLSQGGVVFLGDQVWLGDQDSPVFQVDEAMGAVELKSDLLRIEEVEDTDVVLPVTEVLQGIRKLRRIGEEVRENDNHGTLADFFRDGVESGNQSGFAGGFERSQR